MIDFIFNRSCRQTKNEIGHGKMVLSIARSYEFSGFVDEERPILVHPTRELGIFPARKLDVERILEGVPNKSI